MAYMLVLNRLPHLGFSNTTIGAVIDDHRITVLGLVNHSFDSGGICFCDYRLVHTITPSPVGIPCTLPTHMHPSPDTFGSVG